MFHLDHSRQRNVVSHHQCWPDTEVVQVPALEKIAVHFLITVPELQSRSRRKPVGQPALSTAASAPNPTRQQVSAVGVPIPESPKVPINESRGELMGMWRPYDFSAKSQLVQ